MNNEPDEIYRLYSGDVCRFALRLCNIEALAQDIVQDTMLKAVKSIDKFDGKCSLKTYLCTIAQSIEARKVVGYIADKDFIGYVNAIYENKFYFISEKATDEDYKTKAPQRA